MSFDGPMFDGMFDDGAHYENAHLTDFSQVRAFLDGGVDKLNWVFVGTDGVHGTTSKLNEWPETTEFTILIVRPRLVSCLYGSVEIPTQEDYEWLVEQVKQTTEIIKQQQEPNWKDTDE